MLEISNSFGRNGIRLEILDCGGYSVHKFAGDHRGVHGEMLTLVGFKLSDREISKVIADHEKCGCLIVDRRSNEGH